ncbi:hypothetical protein [Hansschlegelia zhihuaiae]|uniref:Invasion associated locus B family protein n=1 Tax=Hansschlegelia zhihuaiae TaxID=405005 RepID=A0A4Q0M3E7_9HYPH|nr:hypothetical protein [Hansschlegelia zhihuaiae]RXF67421.1 hypothetical protein EK403_21335 [Hansschlegelia zhihuaiae]
MRAIILAAAVLAASPVAAETGRSGVWTFSFEPAASGSSGMVTALAPSPSPSGDPNDPSYLVARCLGGRTELLVGGAGGWGLPRKTIEVTTQIDGGPAETAQWGVSTNGKAAFLDQGVERLLARLPDDGKLRVAVRTASGEVNETIFATTGFAAIREKIAQTCSGGREPHG